MKGRQKDERKFHVSINDHKKITWKCFPKIRVSQNICYYCYKESEAQNRVNYVKTLCQ